MHRKKERAFNKGPMSRGSDGAGGTGSREGWGREPRANIDKKSVVIQLDSIAQQGGGAEVGGLQRRVSNRGLKMFPGYPF